MADQLANVYLEGYSGITASDVASFVGKTFITEDTTVVTSLILALEQRIAQACRRQFLAAANNVDQVYYQRVDAANGKHFLHNFPIKEITKITVDGATKYEKGGQSNVLVVNSDFIVYPDHVLIKNAPASSVDNRQAMVIYYSITKFWGNDVVLAIKQWAAELFLNREYAGQSVSQFSVTGQTLQFDTTTLPKYVQEVVNTYKKMLI